jgi:tRNA pseudouridine38-40 synthase
VTLFEAPAESRPALRVRLLIAYDGRGFHGFALQPGVDTVAGAISGALERALGHPVEITCAGRTDTGVHAWGQVIHFDTTTPAADLDLEKLQRAVSSMCGPAIVVRAAEIAAEGFDARRSARARRYRYTVLNRPVADPFLAATSWHVPDPLDRRVLDLTCDPVIGEHDFTSFCRAPKGAKDYSMVRRVVDARWTDIGDGLVRFDIEATSFCHQMVRSLVGTMVEMGRGHKTAGQMAAILRARSRAAAGDLAPPHGLCLWDVVY